MQIFGQLEMLAAALFPYRWYILAGLAVAAALLAWMGYRNRWDRWAAAHRGPVIGVAVVALVVGGPIGYALGSPLFIRTELTETAPAAATTLLAGEIEGADELHFGSGQVRIVEDATGQRHLVFENISVQNGPDLHVYLSPDPDGYTATAVDLGQLKATDGTFSYAIPESVDLGDVRSVVIWCVPFAVLFATATLSSA